MEDLYKIELTKEQLIKLCWSCETMARLIQGQDSMYQMLFENAWEKRCIKATGKSMDEKFEGGWSKMRQDAEKICKKIKDRFWNMPYNADNGIHYDDTADLLFDMYQVMRHQLWLDKPADKKSNWTVDAFPAMGITGKLIKVEKL